MHPRLSNLGILFLISILCSCASDTTETNKKQVVENRSESNAQMGNGKLLELVSGNESGIDFENRITETDSRNYILDEYMYNGAGVATTDLNNDGLVDIFFTGNQVGNRLYLNKGDFTFEDITKSAGVEGAGWHNGVAIADVNGDGYADIYVCRGNSQETNPAKRENLLFINNRDNTFTESARKYKIADPGYSLNAAFIDYDLDNDLDLMVTNYPPQFDLKLKDVLAAKNVRDQNVLDHLYRNNGDGSFTDVSKAMGVNNFGHGLGLSVSDINKDGYPDIFIANDYVTEDFLYINNKGKGFEQRIKSFMKHASLFSMGCDVADINNDGYPDIAVADMMPEDNYRSKAAMPSMNPDAFYSSVSQGIHAQYMRNALQLNSDVGIFSEIGQMAGVEKTDWSWSMLFGDLDNDGFQDLMITNGLRRDVDEKDVNKKILKLQKKKGGTLAWDEIDGMMHQTKLQNYIYANKNGFQFENVSDQFGFEGKAFSQGAALADLDNDGDLDIVINNSDDPAFLYKNNANELLNNNWLKIKLIGEGKNRSGYGAKVTLNAGDQTFYREVQPERGYLSASEPGMHVGLGTIDKIDALIVTWNNGHTQTLNDLDVNQLVSLRYANSALVVKQKEKDKNTIFKNVGQITNINFQHQENVYEDFEKQVLLPQRMSQFGPAIAVGDVNGDGLDDLFCGGAKDQASVLYIQGENAKFSKNKSQPWKAEKWQEDVAAIFVDVDKDGDMDLYVGSGGAEFPEGNKYFEDRLYINNGGGQFTRSKNSIPSLRSSTSCVKALDFDRDGDEDLFIGSRFIPDKYPYAPTNYLLINNNGKYTDEIDQLAPDMKNIGMVSDALWTDMNQDQHPELIIVGEWSPINVFTWTGSEFHNITATLGLDKWTGWWNCVVHTDLDQDGDPDYVVGNLGLNYKYKASTQAPFEVYCDDFDKNGTYDIVLGYYQNGTQFPVRGLQCSSEQMPFVAEEFKSYSEFGRASLADIYGERLQNALHLQVNTFESIVIWNNDGKFEVEPLPLEAQIAPVNGIIAGDFTRDGYPDLLMAGNLMHAEVETGAADAGLGLLLKGGPNKQFTVVTPGESGFIAPNDVKNIAILNKRAKFPMIIVANNNETLQVYGF